MATYGYSGVPDRGFVSFQSELAAGAWKQIVTKKYDPLANDAAPLLDAPQPVVWKVRLTWSIARLLETLGAQPVITLDQTWDACQRRLFHRVGEAVDSEEKEIREAADRLRAGLLLGGGTGQTLLDYDAEVDFGRQQIALTSGGGPLAADAKKAKLTDCLSAIARSTEALAKGLGRTSGDKRRPPSRMIRDALATCAGTFNNVHDSLVWFIANTAPGTERDQLAAMLRPLEDLLARHAARATAAAPAEVVAAPARDGTPAVAPA